MNTVKFKGDQQDDKSSLTLRLVKQALQVKIHKDQLYANGF
jgi:hypothetical protein